MKRIFLLLVLVVATLTANAQIDEGFVSCRVTVTSAEDGAFIGELEDINQLFFTSKGNLYASMGDFEVIYITDSIHLEEGPDSAADLYYCTMTTEDGIFIGFSADYIDIEDDLTVLRYWVCDDRENHTVTGW